MSSEKSDQNEEISQKLEDIIGLLQDFMIAQGFRMKMGTEAIRALVQVDKKRVNRISKLMKKQD